MLPTILLFSLVCFLHSPVVHAAEKATGKTKVAAKAKMATKTAKAKTRIKTAKVTRTPPPPPVIVSEGEVRASFEMFTLEWMEKLVKTEEFQRTQQMRYSPTTDGVAGEYTGYLPKRFTSVKTTKSVDTPYVGSLTYYEKRMRCLGKTKEEVLKASCQEVSQIPVKEIFRFTKGKWVY